LCRQVDSSGWLVTVGYVKALIKCTNTIGGLRQYDAKRRSQGG
jgi:hypothetical protein